MRKNRLIKIVPMAALAFSLFISIIVVKHQPNFKVENVLEDKGFHQGPLKSFTISNSKQISAVKAQITDEETDISGFIKTRRIRFVAGVNNINYSELGFRITNNGTTVERAITKVFTHIMAGTDIYSASDVFGEQFNYLIAFEIRNVPSANYSSDLLVTAYGKDNLDNVYCSTIRKTSINNFINVPNEQVTGININGTNLRWTAVSGATSYDLSINGVTYVVIGTQYSISSLPTSTVFTLKVTNSDANPVRFDLASSLFTYKVNGELLEIIGINTSASVTYVTIPKEIYIQGQGLKKVDTIKITTANSISSTQKRIIDIQGCNIISTTAFISTVATTIEKIIVHSANIIEDNAFSGCTNLLSVDFYDVKQIGNTIFIGCNNIAKMICRLIPENVASGWFGSSNTANFYVYADINNYDSLSSKLELNITKFKEISTANSFKASKATRAIPKDSFPDNDAFYLNSPLDANTGSNWFATCYWIKTNDVFSLFVEENGSTGKPAYNDVALNGFIVKDLNASNRSYGISFILESSIGGYITVCGMIFRINPGLNYIKTLSSVTSNTNTQVFTIYFGVEKETIIDNGYIAPNTFNGVGTFTLSNIWFD